MAKDQGLRSRAAFKLSQINRKFPFLEKCQHGLLDLCAAPGGWTQIAARTCPKHIPIIAVDILPIRAISPQVKTIVGDITTSKCQADIRSALAGTRVDAVLHDGAPNVGAEYGKDAYVQNELAVHALRCATQHLLPGGTFCTKVYRSRDYASLNWVLQQFFDSVQAIKPAASRSQSAEIFLIAQKYKAPTKIDSRMLDPKHIFADVAGDSTGGVALLSKGMTVLDKNWDKKTRRRGGYDMDHLDASMRHIESVYDFVNASSLKAAVQLLSTSTGLSFSDTKAQETTEADSDNEENETRKSLNNFMLHHPYTTPEIKECMSDLQVLNQSDFKMLLSWRTKMQEALKAREESAMDEVADHTESSADDDQDSVSEEEEEEIQKEIDEMKLRRQREKKRLRKKERAIAAKRRRKAAMDVMVIDTPEHDKIFSLATLTSKGDLEAAADVNLDQMTDEQIFGPDSDEDVDDQRQDVDLDDDDHRTKKLEDELNSAYDFYLKNTKNGAAKSGTKMAKRSRKSQREKFLQEAAEDQELAINSNIDYSTRTYAEMLQGPKDSDDENESSDGEVNDGYHDDPLTPEEHQDLMHRMKMKTGKKEDRNPLIYKGDDESPAMKTARWFSNPLFESIGKAAEELVEVNVSTDLDENSSDEISSEGNNLATRKKRKLGLNADEVLASIPKTDKQIRHEKRLKALARQERKLARRAKRLGDAEEDFELVPADDERGEESEEDKALSNLSPARKKKELEARELIKAGMGKQSSSQEKNVKGFEVVRGDDGRPLPVLDDRKYDDNDGYDSDDYARTLALGTMMLRRSKEKALVDASYNRYAWNDPDGLPDWFVDDENKHHRPQLPIPPSLLAKMKETMMALSTKPIKKVAEARARKRKRAQSKLAAAKKQAEAVANSSEMSESMKLKAISKALRGQEVKKPGKTYVVAKKGRTGPGGAKGVKLVDKRMKADQRGLDKKSKKGKGGSKRRR